MKILVSGSSGLVGSHLVSQLKASGHEIARLVRHAADRAVGEIYWEPSRGSIDKEALEAFAPEAVINLAGENIASGRWTEAKKKEIRDSRVEGTKILSKALAHLKLRPQVFINASALGYYGERGEEWMTETSEAGLGFLPEVCQAWEDATQEAKQAKIRTINLRIGIVLSKEGGALKKMLTPFCLGLGGVMGNGRQFMSWIALEDLIRILLFALEEKKLEGPVNAVSPHPVTNKVFTKTLGRVLLRPTIFPMPASVARMIFGEMADDLLLASTRARPEKLKAVDFEFKYPQLKEALKSILGKK
ncbi:MAG: TIGR01777 family oxidoreductase [Deltaproteobacteria bacterium]|nr:TIGR01777 family oxidoreductase [Deltaproteobacteria bacterium]